MGGNMRVLVTGGAGFIGSAVCRHFIAELGHEVVVLDKLTYAGNLDSLKPVTSHQLYTFEKHDICDGDAVNGVFLKYQPDATGVFFCEKLCWKSRSEGLCFAMAEIIVIMAE